jgi:hypothetical protein
MLKQHHSKKDPPDMMLITSITECMLEKQIPKDPSFVMVTTSIASAYVQADPRKGSIICHGHRLHQQVHYCREILMLAAQTIAASKDHRQLNKTNLLHQQKKRRGSWSNQEQTMFAAKPNPPSEPSFVLAFAKTNKCNSQ